MARSKLFRFIRSSHLNKMECFSYKDFVYIVTTIISERGERGINAGHLSANLERPLSFSLILSAHRRKNLIEALMSKEKATRSNLS